MSGDARFFGIYRAIVGGAADPLGAGRVIVTVPAVFSDREVWARVACERFPGQGDEVVVAFEAGDLQAPIVLGVFWNGEGAAHPATIYKIVSAADWRAAERARVFRGAAIDLADGFIHFSSAAQVEETAAKHFRRRDDLLLVAVDAGKLGDALKWEVSRGDALFPHLYAPLSLDAVTRVDPLPLGANGRHDFSGLL